MIVPTMVLGVTPRSTPNALCTLEEATSGACSLAPDHPPACVRLRNMTASYEFIMPSPTASSIIASSSSRNTCPHKIRCSSNTQSTILLDINGITALIIAPIDAT